MDRKGTGIERALLKKLFDRRKGEKSSKQKNKKNQNCPPAEMPSVRRFAIPGNNCK